MSNAFRMTTTMDYGRQDRKVQFKEDSGGFFGIDFGHTTWENP